MNEIQNVEDVDQFYKLLKRIEEAFADPYQVTYKKETAADGV